MFISARYVNAAATLPRIPRSITALSVTEHSDCSDTDDDFHGSFVILW
jgi:hypothetical protein